MTSGRSCDSKSVRARVREAIDGEKNCCSVLFSAHPGALIHRRLITGRTDIGGVKLSTVGLTCDS